MPLLCLIYSLFYYWLTPSNELFLIFGIEDGGTTPNLAGGQLKYFQICLFQTMYACFKRLNFTLWVYGHDSQVVFWFLWNFAACFTWRSFFRLQYPIRLYSLLGRYQILLRFMHAVTTYSSEYAGHSLKQTGWRGSIWCCFEEMVN